MPYATDREILLAEHDDTGSVGKKKVLAYGWDTDNVTPVKMHVDSDGNSVLGNSNPEGFIHLQAAGVTAASTGYMLIDLSDTVNWPHQGSGDISIYSLFASVSAGIGFAGSVKIGFLSGVTATNGDMNVIWSYYSQATGAASIQNSNFQIVSEGKQISCEPDLWFGPTVVDSTLFQTDVNIQGPDGATSYPSGNGDLVMIITRTAGTIDVGVSVAYRTSASIPLPSASISPSISPSVSTSISPSVSPSVSVSISPSTSPSASISPSVSPSVSVSISPSVSPSVSVSISPSVSVSISPSVSVSISLSTSPSVSPSASISPSISSSISVSISPSTSPSASISPSVSPSTSPSASISPSISISTSPSQSFSPSISTSISLSISPSVSLSISPSVSPSISPSVSPSV